MNKKQEHLSLLVGKGVHGFCLHEGVQTLRSEMQICYNSSEMEGGGGEILLLEKWIGGGTDLLWKEHVVCVSHYL